MPSEHDAFVSFNKADKDFTENLVKRIESEKFKGRNLKCFYSEWDIQPGQVILLEIEKAEPSSRFVIFVMSPDWLKSHWTTLERLIPVHDDPAGVRQRIIPIVRRKCDIPPSLRIIKRIDFTNNAKFENSAKILVARLKGESIRSVLNPSAGHQFSTVASSAEAFPGEEIIATNLFLVTELPALVYSMSSIVKARDDIWPIVGDAPDLPPFAFREDNRRIYSFSTLEKVAKDFTELLLPTTKEIEKTQFFLRGANTRILTELLNRSMTAFMKNLGMVYDYKNTRKTFFPIREPSETIRHVTWKSPKRTNRRILVSRSKTGTYYAHRYCKATFVIIAGIPYLRLIPGWHFTSDGMETPVSEFMMTSLSSRWMNMERNHTVIDNVRFWASLFSNNSDTISLPVGGSTDAKVSSNPIFATLDRGIEGDYRERLWYEEVPSSDEGAAAAKDDTGPTELLEESMSR